MSDDIAELLFNALNEQGYLFQEACYHALKKRERTTEWDVKPYEYPVSINGQDTRIDMVLRSRTPGPEVYALLECKRSDPAFAFWLFGGGEVELQPAQCLTLCLKCGQYSSNQPFRPNRLIERLNTHVRTYAPTSWLEVKKGKGNRASSPQPLEDAFGQVFKGVEGFAAEQLRQREKNPVPFTTYFLPVIVTTAQLYLASYKPKDIDLSTGKIRRSNVNFGPGENPSEEEPWTLVNYGLGQSIAPDAVPRDFVGVDPADLEKYKSRSVFVVNSKHLVQFFSTLRPWW